MSNTSTHTYVEYAIAFGDGEIDDNLWNDFDSAKEQIDATRISVARGNLEPEDYPEPMTVVTRTVTRTISATPWEEASS
jgi:hypothetical protein